MRINDLHKDINREVKAKLTSWLISKNLTNSRAAAILRVHVNTLENWLYRDGQIPASAIVLVEEDLAGKVCLRD